LLMLELPVAALLDDRGDGEPTSCAVGAASAGAG